MTKQYGEVLEELLWVAIQTEGRDPVLTPDQRTAFWKEFARLCAEGHEEMMAFKADVSDGCQRLGIDEYHWNRPEDGADDSDMIDRVVQSGPAGTTDRELCRYLLTGNLDLVSECLWTDYCTGKPLAEIWQEAMKGRPVPVPWQERGIRFDDAPQP